MDEMSYLRQLVQVGATRRYGARPADENEDLSLRARAWKVIDHELSVIASLGFAGYFLVVWDIVQFCQRSNIYCQGRGSAANSAVCYSLDITRADAVSLGLLFERFLSPERDGPPDIDIDIESGRREEVIQYVYQRHGRHHAAQVANVITYRARSAVRDMARALGFAPGQQDAWSKQVEAWGALDAGTVSNDHSIPQSVLALAQQVQDAPRHLGIHSGGMVMCDRPVTEVCPVEWGRMEGRSVLQWDKDDCAAAGLVKFDLLGLGMLTALHKAVDLIAEFRGVQLDLASIPQSDEVYAMLCRADTVGVFQIESRAQMATLPRLKPRRFYDLVVEVALIRPGPIQGGSVHPYIRRRNGQEPITYLHPLLENALGKTLGVPLFQEQLMQMAIDVAGFTPAEADELRQAMGSKRSQARMQRLGERLYAGMAERGIRGDIADQIFTKMSAFASYGFPESHSVSFAYLVYSSAYIKLHEPAAFCAALMNSQPMGFWSPHSLSQDARRHGVVVLTPDINASRADATLEPCEKSTGGARNECCGCTTHRGWSSIRKHGGLGSPCSAIAYCSVGGSGNSWSFHSIVRSTATRCIVECRRSDSISTRSIGWCHDWFGGTAFTGNATSRRSNRRHLGHGRFSNGSPDRIFAHRAATHGRCGCGRFAIAWSGRRRKSACRWHGDASTTTNDCARHHLHQPGR
jgi:error-prone DNA polymerase